MYSKSTFENLTDSDKKRIIDTALEEFIRHDYESASLSTIIKNLNLAKGSFYRYFDSKQDVYLYLIDYCLQLRIAFDKKHITKNQKDFKTTLRQHVEMRSKFKTAFPTEYLFLYQIQQLQKNAFVQEISAALHQKILALFTTEIKQAIKRKELRSDIDPEMMAETLIQHLHALQTHKEKYPEKKHKEIEDGFMKLLFEGIGKK